MFFHKIKEKKLKMIWEVSKTNKRSYLIGTAHYFPYSFKTSLQRYLDIAATVIFEGPLDPDNMNKVQAAGNTGGNHVPLVNDLNSQTITAIYHALFPECRRRNPYWLYNFRTGKTDNPVYDMIKGMKAWLAFFTIWFEYLKRNGWKYSVDLEAFNIAVESGKKIITLETIEEQITVLEKLSYERIINFLNRVNHWDKYMKDYIKNYLKGDSENLSLIARGYPNRTAAVIDRRDRIFYERMLPYIEQGGAVACIGAPHIRGVSQLLTSDGYLVQKPHNL
jgi:uncharacterized protein YbaP (TraB family)